MHLFKLGLKGLLSAIMFGVARASVSLSPTWLRVRIYERLLPKRPQ